MGDFIYFTEEQKERANAVPIESILRREGEQTERSGSELRWKRHSSVTLNGNRWYRHSEKIGSHAIDFMQEFYGMTFPEAVTYLLDGETGQVIHGRNPYRPAPSGENRRPAGQSATDPKKERKEKPPKMPKVMTLPEKNETMKRVFAYLIQKRLINRDVLLFFVKNGTLYESKEHHNAVFLGMDKEGKPRHAHQRGTYSEGESFRINTEGADPCYGFGHAGKSDKLYVFEAPIDFLSFLTLYPQGWQDHSYIVLNGVAEHAMLRMLRDYPHIKKAVLCLDHDPAGIEACGRLAEILLENGHKGIQVLQPVHKDWNEDLKERNGIPPQPAQEHPQIMECLSWLETLKEVSRHVDEKYAAKEYLIKYYRDICEGLKAGPAREHLENTFDSDGLFLSGVAVKCIETYSRNLGREITTDSIIDCFGKRYYPHRDKGNIKSRLTQLQKAFQETITACDQTGSTPKENAETVIRKCMGLAMECIKAHIFVSVQMKEQEMLVRNQVNPIINKEHRRKEIDIRTKEPEIPMKGQKQDFIQITQPTEGGITLTCSQ